MAHKNKNEDALSEVISVILLIAVSVILAAVIASFAFGMAGNMQKGKIVAATISRVSGSSVSVMFAGGQNAGSVTAINWTVNGAAPATTINGTIVTPGLQDRPTTGGILNVGAKAVLAASNSGKDRVIGVAVFSDGSKLVILDKTL